MEEISEKDKTTLLYLLLFYGKSIKTNPSLNSYYMEYFSGKISLDNYFNMSNWFFDQRFLDYGFGIILSRYIRYQFQIIKFIDSYQFSGERFTQERIKEIKYTAAKHFRSQLTHDEQLILYYNAITPLGKDWIRNEYFQKYKVIKNLIFPLCTGYHPVKWAKETLNLNQEQLNDFFEFKDKNIHS